MTTIRLNHSCTTEQLIIGLKICAALYTGEIIQAIQFEDGSGVKFNIQINSKWQFVNLSEFSK